MNQRIFMKLLLSFVSLLRFASFVRAVNIPCLSISTSLEDLVTCLEGFTVRDGFYFLQPEKRKYCIAQPTSSVESSGWITAVTTLLNVDANCPNVDVPGLTTSYSMALFTERIAGGKSFCVMSEKRTDVDSATTFNRGWGHFIVPATRAQTQRALHFSVPHPLFAPGTARQAAALFKQTGAKSLLISGRHPRAFPFYTDCSRSGSMCIVNFKTDPEYENIQAFHWAMVAIRTWQIAHGGCAPESCGFIQLTNMQPSDCPPFDIFLSSGVASIFDIDGWYSSPNRPARRLKAQLDISLPPAPGFSHAVPSVASLCPLTAGQNIFARIAGNVPSGSVCRMYAPAGLISGVFVRIAQLDALTAPTHYPRWAQAFRAVYPIFVFLNASGIGGPETQHPDFSNAPDSGTEELLQVPFTPSC